VRKTSSELFSEEKLNHLHERKKEKRKEKEKE
jgi:hypothetical protein